MNEPEFFKADDPRVTVNGQPLRGDGRFITEDVYQKIKYIYDPLHFEPEKQKSFRALGLHIKWWLLIIAAVIAIFFVCRHFYEKYQSAIANGKIEITTTEKQVIDQNIVNQKETIVDSGKAFVKRRDDAAAAAIEIQNQSNNKKPIHYEKPEIHRTDADAMRQYVDTVGPTK